MNRRPIGERLLGPAQAELGCEECFEYLDRYVETELTHAGRFELCATCVAPNDCARVRHCLGMRAHLDGCPACAEEYTSLKALLQAPDSPSLDGPPGLN